MTIVAASAKCPASEKGDARTCDQEEFVVHVCLSVCLCLSEKTENPSLHPFTCYASLGMGNHISKLVSD